MRSRQILGYLVQVDGAAVIINLEDSVRSHVAGHIEGISSFEQPGDLIAIEAGSDIIVGRVQTLLFAEPRDFHAQRLRPSENNPPLRQLKATIIGLLRRQSGYLKFQSQTTRLPTLGACAFPLSGDELRATFGDVDTDSKNRIEIGHEARSNFLHVSANLNTLLARHVAVLGATGQGKTHLVADIVQQVANLDKARIVVFDVNGEYYPAFKHLGEKVKYTAIGSNLGRNAPINGECFKIPYYALGRHGLFRLLLPSERTQAPALRFAIEHLPYVDGDENGARNVNSTTNVLFDDCRTTGAQEAANALETIKQKQVSANKWAHMKSLSCLAADYYVIKNGRNGFERDAFLYGHIQSLISRINSLILDERFQAVVDVAQHAASATPLNMETEAAEIISRIFGKAEYNKNDASVHIVDLSQLTQDLMPFVLGALLELFAEQLFRRGAGRTHPTLLVLEEAHHYLRQLSGDGETGQHTLAYERLAKEGRKFGLSLLVSTQRPSELSPTVLAQCGSWIVFRLTNELDKRAVTSAAEDSGANVSEQLSGLGRGEAIAFGAAFQLPIRIRRDPLPENMQPDSQDPPFESAWSSPSLPEKE